MTSWLLDKSAFVRLQLDQVIDGQVWKTRIDRGLMRISTITRLELGYSARTGVDGREGFRQPPVSLMPVERITPAIEDRAEEVQMLFADRGQHRAPSIQDLLIAATAEKAGLTLLTVDKDFELIAEATGQPVEMLALC